LNILFTSHRFHPDIGGIESISAQLASFFVQSGHSVRLITQSVGNYADDQQYFPFLILRQPSWLDMITCYRWADVIFQNNIEAKLLWPLIFFRKPLVVGLQTWIRSVDGKRSLLQLLKQVALRTATEVVACSEAIRADSTPHAVVIGNPYRSSLFRSIPEESRRSALVFLGRLVSDKGVDLLLRAYSEIDRPDWPLTIIGTGPEGPSLKQLAKQLDISSRVTFLGPLQGEALVRILNQHEIMVVPSKWHEPFGIVALEGLACGCVVLASDGGGLPDAVGSAGLLFRRGDQADLSSKLRELIENVEQRNRLRVEASAHLLNFQEKFVCAQYLHLLESVVQAPRLIRRRRVLVVGNYLADQQQSMLRFADLLLSIYGNSSQVVLESPPGIVARLPVLPAIVRKYLSYIDKLLLFPLWLTIRTGSFDLVHIADHSNAYYSFCCPRRKSLVTCHDLLAIRGAFGDPSAACDASPVGIWLQRLIMAGLRRSGAVAFVSNATFHDFQQIIGAPPGQRHAVIPNPLNAPFISKHQAHPLSQALEDQLPQEPYLLMVGHAHPRKNRAIALKLLELLGETSPYRMVFAGAALTPTELAFHHGHPLGSMLLSIPRPSHALLNHLYCHAHALLFPSFSEGFGWPLVEAQTCSCPVIASTTTSIPEVAGDGALYADPTDVSTFAEHVRTLEDPIERARLIQLGLTNTLRYDKEVLADAYRRFAFQQ